MKAEFFSISDDELNKLPEIVAEGMIIQHQHEDGTWEDAVISYGVNALTGEKSPAVGVYTLKDGRSIMGAVMGKLIPRPTLRLKIDPPSNQ